MVCRFAGDWQLIREAPTSVSRATNHGDRRQHHEMDHLVRRLGRGFGPHKLHPPAGFVSSLHQQPVYHKDYFPAKGYALSPNGSAVHGSSIVVPTVAIDPD